MLKNVLVCCYLVGKKMSTRNKEKSSSKGKIFLKLTFLVPNARLSFFLSYGQFLIFRENNPKIQKYFFKFLFSRIYTFHHEFLGFVFK